MALFSATETLRRVRHKNRPTSHRRGRLRDLVALEFRLLRKKLTRGRPRD